MSACEKKRLQKRKMTIEISVSDFLRKDNAALVHLLKVIRKAGGTDGLSTRMLCTEAFDSRSYGLRVIERAHKDGYITRTGEYNKSGGGAKRINKITKKGIKLLKQLGEG